MILENLNGIWHYSATDGKSRNFKGDGTVPGCIHTDLQSAGVLGDLYYRDNAESCQWVENSNVTYKKAFTVTKLQPNTYLTFEGLDVYATVFLNGCKLGECDDMFIPHSFCVDGILKKGENTISVAFRSPIKEVEKLPARSGAFTTERLYTRRIQCTYGWDWVARFVTMGIWRDVFLEVKTADRLDNVYVYTKSINPYSAQIAIRAEFTDITGDSYADFKITDPNGITVFRKSRRILATIKNSTRTRTEEIVDIPNAMLWYPTGYGDQPLYTLKISFPNGEKEVAFGIRTIEILETEDAPGSENAEKALACKQFEHLSYWDKNESSSCFILLVNGVRIFCRGANWVPCEPFVSAITDEKTEDLIKLAKEGNFNMLRVWGGGIFGSEKFYSACDKYGILVTQDFLMACGQYPEEDDEFIRKLSLEAETAAYALRNHPSLVWWSGDNENAVNGDENAETYPGRRAALEGISPVLEALDPARRFLPSSPYGGVPYASAVRGTTHNTQFLGDFFGWVRKGDFSDYRRYFEQYLARFTAEQPAIGMPYLSSLRKFMKDEDIFGDDTYISEYHTKNNPGLGEITLYGYIDKLARGIFGEYTSGYDRIEKMQLLHCEWVRLSLELFRRNMWYSSGIIYWMFNDCWPAANGWSLIDYYTAPKPAFYTFKRCSSPLICSVTEENGMVYVYASNTATNNKNGTYRLYRYSIENGTEAVLAQGDFSVSAGSAAVIASCQMPECNDDTVLLCDIISSTEEHDRAFFLPLRWGDMNWKSVSYKIVEENDTSITVKAETTVPVLLLDVPYRVNENGMFLKKGETVILQKYQKR